MNFNELTCEFLNDSRASKVLQFPQKKLSKNSIFRNLKRIFYNAIDTRIRNLSPLSAGAVESYLDRSRFAKTMRIKTVATALRHTDKDVVLKAVTILKKSSEIDAKKALKASLSHKDPEVVLAGIEALKSFEAQDVITPLKMCLNRKNKKIALQALWALAEFKTVESFDAIESALSINDPEIQQTAQWILKGSKKKRRKA